ncbi:uncharacterized protein LOC144066034 isoform X1 [Stigmatopora argus]
MAFLLSALLLASLCSLASRCDDASSWSVEQSPDVEVEEGQTLEIECCWKGNKRVKVKWLKNSLTLEKLSNRTSTRSCETLVWRHVSENVSGTYECEVSGDIPSLQKMRGNGTVVKVVHQRSNDTAHEDVPGDASGIPIWIPLLISSALGFLLLVLALVCTCKRRAKNGVRVIYETPHVNSDASDPDKRSTGSSAGSSEWRQVLLYESVDYFEHAETKGSG